MAKKDKIYADKIPHVVDFIFDQSVVDVFPDMIRRSVPGYETVIALLAVIAERYFESGSRIYDLGCSLGAATLSVQSRIGCDNVEFVAVDSSRFMLDQCRENFARKIPLSGYQCLEQDIRKVEISNASVVILNFSLQFLPQQDRDKMIRKIYQGLIPGGVLILSEKIIEPMEAENCLLIDLAHGFKSANGYSNLEISQKRSALENVMNLDSVNEHVSRLESAGFPAVQQWFQCFNFVSLLAIK